MKCVILDTRENKTSNELVRFKKEIQLQCSVTGKNKIFLPRVFSHISCVIVRQGKYPWHEIVKTQC